MKYNVNKVLGNNSDDYNKKPYLIKTGRNVGKPYKVAKVCVPEYGERAVKVVKWDNQDVKIGDVLEGEIKEKEFNGVKYLELDTQKENPLVARISAIEFSIANIHRKIDEIVSQVKFLNPGSNLTSAGTEIPDFIPNTAEETIEFEQKMDAWESANEELDIIGQENLIK